MMHLTVLQEERLRVCEQTIFSYRMSAFEAGRALQEIKDGELYRASHESFDTYCRDRFQFTRKRAYQLIQALSVVELVRELPNTIPPDNEAQVRDLTALTSDQDKADAWSKANAIARDRDGPVTARIVREATKGMSRVDKSNAALARSAKAKEKAALPSPKKPLTTDDEKVRYWMSIVDQQHGHFIRAIDELAAITRHRLGESAIKEAHSALAKCKEMVKAYKAGRKA